jgi:hypothetical protein
LAGLLEEAGFQLLGRFDDQCKPVGDATPATGDRHYLACKKGISE